LILETWQTVCPPIIHAPTPVSRNHMGDALFGL
jgi:hypothetical protein